MKIKQFLKRLFTENIVLKLCMIAFAFVLAMAVSAIPPAKTSPAENDGTEVSAVWEEQA